MRILRLGISKPFIKIVSNCVKSTFFKISIFFLNYTRLLTKLNTKTNSFRGLMVKKILLYVSPYITSTKI